jgi:hypothetical protein
MDKRHGNGAFTWPDGDKYIGIWYEESRRGLGVLHTLDGRVLNLDWNEAEGANYCLNVPEKFPPTNTAMLEKQN